MLFQVPAADRTKITWSYLHQRMITIFCVFYIVRAWGSSDESYFHWRPNMWWLPDAVCGPTSDWTKVLPAVIPHTCACVFERVGHVRYESFCCLLFSCPDCTQPAALLLYLFTSLFYFLFPTHIQRHAPPEVCTPLYVMCVSIYVCLCVDVCVCVC